MDGRRVVGIETICVGECFVTRDGGKPFPNLLMEMRNALKLLMPIAWAVDNWTLVIVASYMRVARPFTAGPATIVKAFAVQTTPKEYVEKPNACADDG